MRYFCVILTSAERRNGALGGRAGVHLKGAWSGREIGRGGVGSYIHDAVAADSQIVGVVEFVAVATEIGRVRRPGSRGSWGVC